MIKLFPGTIQMEITMEALHQPTIATMTTIVVVTSNVATAMASDNVHIPITMEVSASQAAALALVLGQNKNLKRNNILFHSYQK